MTAREQLVERAARAMHQAGLDTGTEYADWAQLRPSVRAGYLSDGRAVVDAILPQITTAAEFDAVPLRSVLVADNGDVLTLGYGQGWDTSGLADYWMRRHPSWTVVWQPSDGAT